MPSSTSPPVVLVTAPTLAQAGLDFLDARGCRVLFVSKAGGLDEMQRCLRAEPVAAVISRTLPFTAEAIEAAPQLRVISRHGVGYDNVDIAAATRCGVPVLIAPATNGSSVAELTIGLMLAAMRGIPSHDAAIRSGMWDRSGQGLQLSGRRLGLVGLGRIGRAVASAAAGLGMSVGAYDPFGRAVRSECVMLTDSLEALLAHSDVLSLHCPLTPENHHLIGAAQIARLPPGAVLINTARGGLVDEGALAEALRSGRLAAAGLDTFADEPLRVGHPFTKLPNLVMTPHVGGSTDAALAATALAAAQHALAVLDGEPVNPAFCVNPSTLPSENRE